MPETKHTPYVNARGELISNGSNREVWCGWEHRDTCPLCLEMNEPTQKEA